MPAALPPAVAAPEPLVLLDADCAELARAAAALGPGDALALLVSGDPPPLLERAALPIRLLRRTRLLGASARASLRALGPERALTRAGLKTRRVGIGDRNDGYPVALSRLRARTAAEQVVVGAREPLRPTILETIAADAAERLGAGLAIGEVRVLATGTLMAEVRDDRGRSFLLRVEAQPPAAPDPVQRLLACAPSPEVASRLVAPLVRASLGAHSWTLEERRPGAHPERMTPALWSDCLSFLEALRAVAPPQDAAVRTLRDDVSEIEWLLPPDLARAVREAVEESAGALDGVARGWAHGDFHPRNLLVRDHLETVLDWDAASPASLPLLDLLHLLATTAPGVRRRPHGARCTEFLWPLARAGGDERIRAHCRATGVDPRPDVLEALAVAYWLVRVARDVATFADRAERTEWLRLNVVGPAGALADGR